MNDRDREISSEQVCTVLQGPTLDTAGVGGGRWGESSTEMNKIQDLP